MLHYIVSYHCLMYLVTLTELTAVPSIQGLGFPTSGSPQVRYNWYMPMARLFIRPSLAHQKLRFSYGPSVPPWCASFIWSSRSAKCQSYISRSNMLCEIRYDVQDMNSRSRMLYACRHHNLSRTTSVEGVVIRHLVWKEGHLWFSDSCTGIPFGGKW